MYSEENIRKITFAEAIRKRPGMYIGSVNERGVMVMLKSLINDILTHTKCDYLQLDFQNGGVGKLRFDNIRCRIKDDLATRLDMMRNKNAYYLDFLVLNALSSNFKLSLIDSSNATLLLQQFEEGILKEGNIESKEYDCAVIEIDYILDYKVFGESFEWNIDYLVYQIREYSYLYRTTRFDINYLVDKEPCRVFFHYKNGLIDRINTEKLNGLGGSYFDTSFQQSIDDFSIDVAFAFREYDVDTPFLKSYVNDYYTPYNGSHVDGLLKGLSYALIKYLQKHGLTEQYEISEEKIKEHLMAVINLKIDTPIFSGSTRNKLNNPNIIEPIAEYVSNIFFTKIEEESDTTTSKLMHKFKIRKY